MKGLVGGVAEILGAMLHRRTDGDELGDLIAPSMEIDLEAHADDSVGPQGIRLFFEALHRELARMVERRGHSLELAAGLIAGQAWGGRV